MPGLSVIVPVYNTEKYLPECIDSILSQTYTDFELILVDDGSTDRSGSICEEYSRIDDRIRVIHQKNGGVTAARKSGTQAAVGDYIAYIDSDDYIAPSMFQQMLMKARLHDLDMILCDMVVEKQGGSTVIPSSPLSGLFVSAQLEQQIYSNMLFDFSENKPGLSLNLWNKIFRSTIVKPALLECPNHVTYGEDALVSLICLLRSRRVFIMEESPFYHYRQTSEFQVREQKISLLPRLADFALNTQLQFSRHHFDDHGQLSGYIAQVSLYCTRQILVRNQEHSLQEKLALVRDYYAKPHIQALMEQSEQLVCDRKLLKKIRLVNRKRFRFLYGCFYGRQIIQRIISTFRGSRKQEV